MLLKLLLKRGNIYYFRWQIPTKLRKKLGQREILRSLKTDNLYEAVSKLEVYEKWMKRVKEVTDDNYLEVMAELKELYSSQPPDPIKGRFSSLKHIDAYKRHLNHWLESYRGLQEAIEYQVEPDTETAREAFENSLNSLEIDLAGMGYKLPLKGKVLDNLIDLHAKSLIQSLENDSSQLSTSPQRVALPKKNTPKLSEVIEEFLINKEAGKKIRETTKTEYRTTFKDLVFILGDIPVDQLKYDDACSFRDNLKKIPAHRSKRYPGLNAEQLLEMDLPNTEYLSNRSISEKLGFARSVYTWLKAKELVTQNPFHTVTIQTNSQPTKDLTIQDLNTIFESALYDRDSTYHQKKTTTASHWWLPILCLYTGARPSELVQARISDLKAYAGVKCLLITDDPEDGLEIKTESARRPIPLHPVILNLGFDEYVSEMSRLGHKKVLGGITEGKRKAGDQASKWWNQRYRKKYLPADFIQQKKTLYSFRPTYITQALEYCSLDQKIVEVMVGHKVSSDIDMSGYIHRHEDHHLEKLIPSYYKEQEKLVFEGLNISHLKDGWKGMTLVRN